MTYEYLFNSGIKPDLMFSDFIIDENGLRPYDSIEEEEQEYNVLMFAMSKIDFTKIYNTIANLVNVLHLNRGEITSLKIGSDTINFQKVNKQLIIYIFSNLFVIDGNVIDDNDIFISNFDTLFEALKYIVENVNSHTMKQPLRLTKFVFIEFPTKTTMELVYYPNSIIDDKNRRRLKHYNVNEKTKLYYIITDIMIKRIF